MRNPRVLVTNATSGRSGVDVTALQVSRGLAARGWDVHFVAPRTPELEEDLIEAGIQIYIEPSLTWWFPPTVSEESFEDSRELLTFQSQRLARCSGEKDTLVGHCQPALAPNRMVGPLIGKLKACDRFDLRLLGGGEIFSVRRML